MDVIRKGRGVVLALATAGLIGGCAPVIKNHGYAPAEGELSGIEVGEDTRATVRSKIGRPGGTGVFSNEGWYYVATKVEHYTYNEPKVIDRRVVAVLFGKDDVVTSVKQYGLKDGKVVDLESKTTPTYGRELTILEQLLGNIGAIPTDVFTSE